MTLKENILKHKFIITGSSGWIGRSMIEMLYSYFGENLNENLVALSNSSISSITLSDGFKVNVQGYEDDIKKSDNYILCHFAFLTLEKISEMSKEEYVSKNLNIRNTVADIINKIKPKSILYSSSGAVYKKNDLYGAMKLEDEKFFTNLSKEIECNIAMPRIFNIGGPYINKYNVYAISDFIVQLVSTKKIKINSPQIVTRSYIHSFDLFKICFSWLFDQENQKKCLIFDTRNEIELNLVDLANMICKILSLDGEIMTNENYPQQENPSYYVGNGDVINKLCKKYFMALKDHEFIIKDTYDYLISNMNKK